MKIPIIKIRVKNLIVNIHKFVGKKLIIGNGIIIVISTSNIRNIKVIEKNWIENDIRDWDRGSNPHSNGDNFSRFLFKCLFNRGKININNIITVVKIK